MTPPRRAGNGRGTRQESDCDGAAPDPLTGQFFRWALQSAFSFVANVALTVFFREVLGLSPPVSFALALGITFVVNFLALRYFVFDITSGSARTQLVRFGLLTLVFRSAEWCVFSFLHVVGAADYRVLVVAVLTASALVKFLSYRWALLPTRRPER